MGAKIDALGSGDASHPSMTTVRRSLGMAFYLF
jgi:hypothetical protein